MLNALHSPSLPRFPLTPPNNIQGRGYNGGGGAIFQGGPCPIFTMEEMVMAALTLLHLILPVLVGWEFRSDESTYDASIDTVPKKISGS